MTFSIKKSFKDSWKMFFSKKIYLPFVAVSVVSVLGLYLMFGIGGFAAPFFITKGLGWLLILVLLALFYFAVYFILTTVFLPLQTYEKGEVHFKKVFTTMWNYKLILKAAGLVLIIMIGALVGGLILSRLGGLVHPILGMTLFALWVGFIAVRFAFSIYIIVDSKSGVISSLKKSHAMMKKNGWRFALFIICVSVISILVQLFSTAIGFVSPTLAGVVSVLIGIAFAPWFSLLTVSPYIQIKGHHTTS